MGIKKKITLALFLASSVPLIIFIVINFYFSENIAKNNAVTQNLKSVQVVEEKISGLIDKNLNGVRIISRNPVVRAFDVDKTRQVLTESLKVYTDLSLTVITKPDANQFARSDNSKLTNVKERSFFQQAIKGKEEVVSEVIVNKDNGKLVTVLATPVRDEMDGKIIGVCQGTMELKMLNNYVREFSKGNVNVYILDRDGKLLAHPSKKLDKPQDRTDLSNFEFVKSGLSGKSSSEVVTKDNEKMLVSYIRDKKTGWLICAEIPYSIAIASSIKSSIITSLIGIVILFATCILLFILVGYSIKPIKTLLSSANSIAEGDLRIEHIDVNSKDEIGVLSKTFEKMAYSLHGVMSKVKTYSSNFSQASKEMADICQQQTNASTNTANSVNEIAEGTELVNSSINEINSNMDNLNGEIAEINKKSNRVVKIIENASVYSENGSKALNKVNSSIESIQQSVNDTFSVIKKLDEHSKTIGQITEVIRGISDQTNLLALNAAIEAARAGEQGKGFAVVAEEVRQLAEQSGDAARRVNDLINGIQKENKNVVVVIDKQINEVNDGSKVIIEANRYFDMIFKSIQEISANIKEVNESMDHMAKNSGEISSNAVTMIKLSEKVTGEAQSISASTEEQVASIEEMTASAQSLDQMADSLKNLTNKFKIE